MGVAAETLGQRPSQNKILSDKGLRKPEKDHCQVVGTPKYNRWCFQVE